MLTPWYTHWPPREFVRLRDQLPLTSTVTRSRGRQRRDAMPEMSPRSLVSWPVNSFVV
jgi:hypothetical protein